MIILHPTACNTANVRALQERTGMIAVITSTGDKRFRAELIPSKTPARSATK